MPDDSLRLLHNFHIRFTVSTKEDSADEWKSGESRAYPPNCSVILLISLFKSLSVLRVPSILSTECSTVV
jgi:hypothetical protein